MADDAVGNDNCGANSQSDGHHVVLGARLVEVLGQRPRSCVGVVRLDGSTGPGSVTVAVNEEIAVALHNGDHDSVVDETAQDSTINLSKEHDTGWDLDCMVVSIGVHEWCRKDKTYGIHSSSGHYTGEPCFG